MSTIVSREEKLDRLAHHDETPGAQSSSGEVVQYWNGCSSCTVAPDLGNQISGQRHLQDDQISE